MLKSIQLRKEARQVLGPSAVIWAALAMATLQRNFEHNWVANGMEAVIFIIMHFGVAMLAAATFGEEIQSKTLTLLLTQPLERSSIWAQKFVVTIFAVIPPAGIYILGCYRGWFLNPESTTLTFVWLMCFTCAAPLWALVARSTLGGVVLNCAFHYFWFAVYVILSNYFEWVWAPSPLLRRITVTIFIAYWAVAVWLGRWMFIRYQDKQQTHSGLIGFDLQWVPAIFRAPFAFHPDQPTLNLVRRELRLLGLIWPISGLIIIPLIVLFAYRTSADSTPIVVSMGTIFLLSTLIAILAGTLSLGEDRSFGTHAWHLTLPVSARKQWSIKLLSGVIVSFIFGCLWPMFGVWSTGRLSSRRYLDHDALWIWPAEVLLLTLASYWCSTATNSTVRAAVLVFPMLIAMAFVELGTRFVVLERAAASKWAAKVWFDRIDPFRITALDRLEPYHLLLIWMTPIVLFTLWQSFRLFKSQPSDSLGSILRRAWKPIAVSFCASILLNISFAIYVSALLQAQVNERVLFGETHTAIESLTISRSSSAERGAVLTIGADELSQTASLSPRTRDWLRGATINVGPPSDIAHESARTWVWSFEENTAVPRTPYLATIHLADGRKCELSCPPGSSRGWQPLAGRCD
jgi:ABC-type Na+ efflux pump permease subunit